MKEIRGRGRVLKTFASFTLVFLSGTLISMYFILPMIRVDLRFAELEAYVVRNSVLFSPVFSGVMLVLLWIFNSALASLLGKRLSRNVRVKLVRVMNEISISYLPILILLLFLIPYTWLSLPNYTASSLDEYLEFVKEFEKNDTYINGILVILFISLMSNIIYPLVFKYRLGFGWRDAALLTSAILLSNALITLWIFGTGQGILP